MIKLNVKKVFFWALAALVCHSPVWAKEKTKKPSIDAPLIAEKIIKPHNGKTALVFDDKGKLTLVNNQGQVIPKCTICSEELEKKWGEKCKDAPKQSDKRPKDGPLICDKLMHTDIKAVTPITVLKHTGSECLSYLLPDTGGEVQAFTDCSPG